MSSLAHAFLLLLFFFFFLILVHNQFKIYGVGRVCFWGGGVKMKSQLETERSSTCLLCLKLSGGKNYKEVAAGEVIAVEAVPLPPPAGSFHT